MIIGQFQLTPPLHYDILVYDNGNFPNLSSKYKSCLFVLIISSAQIINFSKLANAASDQFKTNDKKIMF